MAATPKKGTAGQAGSAGKSTPAAKGAASKKDAGGADLKARFESAAAAAKQTKKRPDNATMLKLYSLYKQATEGDVQGTRPGGFDFVGGAKHDAWTKLKGTSRDDAMNNYIKQVERLNRE
jgi:diazepam-binding inhibitor (GABA receptor modulating acyl-CoA-binding protein)